jgi:aminomethyltransferase
LFAQWRDGVKQKLVGLRSLGPAPIRSHTSLVSTSGQIVGEVTSGTLSPSINQPIMLAYVDTSAMTPPILALVRNQQIAIEAVKLPFVAKQYKR